MNPKPRVPPEQFVESMKEEMDQYLREVMEAVNTARVWPRPAQAPTTAATVTSRVSAVAKDQIAGGCTLVSWQAILRRS